MSTLPLSPRALKGALVTLASSGEPRSVIPFQYNPEKLTRTLQTQMVGGDYGQPVRLYGPPKETISFDAELDATDQLADGQPLAVQAGLHPMLAALELLLYPASIQVLADDAMAELGSAAIIPPEEPLTLLVWGPSRVLPVELTSLTITEEEFDTSLNPIRARVQLQLQVLSYLDLGPDSRGGALFMTHQVQKEALARANNVAGSLSTILSVLFPGGGTNGQGP